MYLPIFYRIHPSLTQQFHRQLRRKCNDPEAVYLSLCADRTLHDKGISYKQQKLKVNEFDKVKSLSQSLNLYIYLLKCQCTKFTLIKIIKNDLLI